MARNVIEIKIKQKKKTLDKIEYTGSNRIRYWHWLDSGASKIYVNKENLEIVIETMNDLGLEYDVKYKPEDDIIEDETNKS